MLIAMRILGSFDQLILTSQFDLLRHGQELFHNNIVEYQLMPLFKVISSHTYTYSSIGQYVIEAATGINIEGPYTLPNSNLILESILTSGIPLGLVIFVVELSVFYWMRESCVEKPAHPADVCACRYDRLRPVWLVFLRARMVCGDFALAAYCEFCLLPHSCVERAANHLFDGIKRNEAYKALAVARFQA